ncbi:MAG: SHOCT domain-containing protein [Oscillospiraceae bacterium]|nr:SHOCT domain-containing protein [Oscillospiraceae bacterium]MCL2279473.1 SHOCT domain-containing protein [Oscillospiraceae bacterium]
MKTKKSTGAGFSFKQLLFYYLAVTKVLYWINMVGTMESLDEFGIIFLNRMVGQDIMVIMVLIAMHFLDKYLFRGKSDNDLLANVKLYSIGAVIGVAIITGYTLLIGLFVPIHINNWFIFILNLVIMFVIVSFFLHIKDRMKKKESALYLPDAYTNESKLAMLKSLCDTGVLTQEEFDEKAAQLERA